MQEVTGSTPVFSTEPLRNEETKAASKTCGFFMPENQTWSGRGSRMNSKSGGISSQSYSSWYSSRGQFPKRVIILYLQTTLKIQSHPMFVNDFTSAVIPRPPRDLVLTTGRSGVHKRVNNLWLIELNTRSLGGLGMTVFCVGLSSYVCKRPLSLSSWGLRRIWLFCLLKRDWQT